MAKRKVFSPMICEFLFYDDNGEKKEKYNYIDLKIQIREIIKHPFDREVLTEVLLDLCKDVTGSTRLELFRIYQELELHKDAYHKLRSWRWERVSKGIYELTQMEVRDSYGHITGFINDKRPTIRKQAELATVSLKEEGINYFLDHTKYRISEWQQLKLLDVVRNKKDYCPPPFRLWLTSKNNHVVLFALRLIKYYNQNDASTSLIELLRHKNDHIKKEAIFCIRDFNVTTALPALKTIFWNCTADVKMYLLEAISHLGTEKDIGFIEDIIKKEMAFTVKGKAISALNRIRPEGVLPTQDILPTTDFTSPEVILEDNIPDSHKLPSNDILPSMAFKLSEVESTVNHSISNAILPTVEEKKVERLRNLEVAYETVGFAIPSIFKKPSEIAASDLSFLPIVTDGTSEIKEASIGKSITNKDLHAPIEDFKVNFEEVSSLSIEKELVFDFLPIVVDSMENEMLASELTIIYDEVLDDKKNKELDSTKKEFSIYNLTVLHEEVNPEVVGPESVEIEEETSENEPTRKHKDSSKTSIIFSDAIATETLTDLPVRDEIVVAKTKVKDKEMILEIDWSDAFGPKKKIPVPKNIDIHTENKKPSTGKKTLNIPKPLFYRDELLNTILLLEDIEELGDHREIAYLKILLAQENNAQVRDRIANLISSFSLREKAVHYFKVPTSLTRQSMFYTLFENRDTEVQLMLLNEIAEIGDEMEIPLLKILVKNDNRVIRKAAAKTLKDLNLRLFNSAEENESEENDDLVGKDYKITQKTEDELFAISFDVEISKVKNPIVKEGKGNDAYGNTMFDHLCATSAKLYEKGE